MKKMFRMFRKWNFVPCTTPSESVEIMATYVKNNQGTEYRFKVIGNCFGFEYR